MFALCWPFALSAQTGRWEPWGNLRIHPSAVVNKNMANLYVDLLMMNQSATSHAAPRDIHGRAARRIM